MDKSADVKAKAEDYFSTNQNKRALNFILISLSTNNCLTILKLYIQHVVTPSSNK